jgi:hypothetical protein
MVASEPEKEPVGHVAVTVSRSSRGDAPRPTPNSVKSTGSGRSTAGLPHTVTCFALGRSPLDLDELVEHWTVLEDERGKRGATRLGFALLLEFFTRHELHVRPDLPVALAHARMVEVRQAGRPPTVQSGLGITLRHIHWATVAGLTPSRAATSDEPIGGSGGSGGSWRVEPAHS